MGTDIEIRERQKNHLQVLLDIKESNPEIHIKKLDDSIKRAITPMSQEDIAWVEKIVGIKAAD